MTRQRDKYIVTARNAINGNYLSLLHPLHTGKKKKKKDLNIAQDPRAPPPVCCVSIASRLVAAAAVLFSKAYSRSHSLALPTARSSSWALTYFRSRNVMIVTWYVCAAARTPTNFHRVVVRCYGMQRGACCDDIQHIHWVDHISFRHRPCDSRHARIEPKPNFYSVRALVI